MKEGERSFLTFDSDNEHFSWLDEEYNGTNMSKEPYRITSVNNVECNNDKFATESSDNRFSIEAFRRELDDITKSLDLNTDVVDVVNVGSPISCLSTDIIGAKENNEKDQYLLSPARNDIANDSFLRTFTPSNIYTSRSDKPPRSVASSRKSEPPTPIQTPMRNDYVLRKNRGQNQKHTSQNTTSTSFRMNNTSNPPRSTNNAANKDKAETAISNNRGAEIYVDGVDSSLDSPPMNKTDQRHRAELSELFRTIEAMRATLEQQEIRMRHLEIENSSLVKELKEMKAKRNHYHHGASHSSAMSPPSPPPVVLASRLDGSSHSPFFLSPVNHNTEKDLNNMRYQSKMSPLNSFNGSSPSYKAASLDPNQGRTSCVKAPNQSRHLPTEQHHQRDQSWSRKIARETDIDEFQAHEDDLMDSKNIFSPGTKFVEELSRVVEIQAGFYAPLSFIMDKHFERMSSIQNDGGWNRRHVQL